MEKCIINYKEIILSEAKDIAMQQGITKINIRDVAKNSGICIGTVYNYYPSKGDLLVAVIEDFWCGAFKDENWRDFTSNNFYENLEKIYITLHNYLNMFKENWLEQLSLLKNQDKLLVRKKENEYFVKIYNKIINLIDMDDNLKHYQWSEIISKEKIAEFIFENMINNLRNDMKDMRFFIDILKKVMAN